MKYIALLISIAAKFFFSALFALVFITLSLTIGGMVYGSLVEAGYIERSDND